VILGIIFERLRTVAIRRGKNTDQAEEIVYWKRDRES